MTDATGLCWRLIAGFLGLAVTCRWNMTGATARSALAHDRFSETVSNLLLSGTWLVLQRGLCWIIAGLLRLAVSCRWNMTTWCYRSVMTHCRFSQTFFCHGLEKTAQRYLLQNFQTVYNTSNEYLQLDVEEVGGNRF